MKSESLRLAGGGCLHQHRLEIGQVWFSIQLRQSAPVDRFELRARASLRSSRDPLQHQAQSCVHSILLPAEPSPSRQEVFWKASGSGHSSILMVLIPLANA